MTALALMAALVSIPFGGYALADGTTESPTENPAENPAENSDENPAEGRPQPMLPTVELLVGGVPLVVEVASGGQQRYMGLSFRETLDDNAGMLFVYPRARPLTFTMRNTLLPLSIAFIGDDLVVQQIVEMDVGPGQLFDSASPARYALEVNQGWFERNGIDPGALVAMP